MFLLSGALLLAMQTIPDMTMVEVKEGAKGCEYRAEGRRMTEQQLRYRAKTWARQQRRIEVHGNRNIAYRCVGAVMVIVQEAGVEKVSFIGRPIRAGVVLLGTAPKGCVPIVDGDPITMEALPAQAAKWGHDKAEIHFTPDENSSDACIKSVLTILRDNGANKIGYIGNERYVTDPK